jgi:Response regulator containing CheY-like receiver domain and AraC-type DNA-binding domain
MAYTILIVDDEMTIRDGLKALIGTLDHWVFVGEAANGLQAIEQINRLKPDLVLSDIRMPEMDGLKLLEHLGNMHTETLVIFLTGYPDFEYAQAAVRFGAFDYLLKPMRARDIAEVIRKAEQRIEQLRAIRDQSLQLEQASANLSKSSAERCIREMLYGGTMNQMEWTDCSFFTLYNRVSVISIHTDKIPMPETYPASSILLQDGREEWVILLGWMEEADDWSIADQIRELVGKLANALADRSWKLGVGGVVPFNKASLSYDQSKFAAYLASPERKIVNYREITGADHQLLLYPIEQEFALIRSVKKGDSEEALQLLGKLEQSYRRKTIHELSRHTLQLHVHLQNALSQLTDGTAEPWSLPESVPSDHSLIINQLADGINYCASRIHEHNNRQLNYVIQRVKGIVQEEYGTDLKLGDIAAKLGMNASYLSTLFKQETGASFSDYLSRYRIDRSIQLLKEPALKIYEVAQQVGYTDGRHFSQLFRKAFGMTPFEFRNKHGIASAAGEFEFN